AQEMARCIQCTRCVRFGQEVAGVMELGMVGRGEHSEITAFVGKTVGSELSGNMIDLCPVGALTSKPFRYRARAWELSRRRSVSAHDGLGSNLIVQVKSGSGEVLRVLPLENEDINECWLSDRDRFAYEGLNNADRLTSPMIKQGGEWRQTDWQTALEYVAHGLRNIRHEHGADALAALAAPNSTLEELALLQKTMRGLGSENVDFRLRQSDFALDGKIVPWLGMSIADFARLKNVFVVGSFLRKDHPLLAARLRTATRLGTQVSMLHAVDDDWLMPIAGKMVAAPSAWLAALREVAAAVARARGVAAPAGAEGIEPSDAASRIAASLAGEDAAIMLGNAAAQHPQASQLHALAEWIADNSGARMGYLTEAANTVGGYLAKAYPVNAAANGVNALSLLRQPRKAYLLLNLEPELDCYDPQAARAALGQAEMVVQLSAYRTGMEYADVLLPIAPFSETSGTFVNCEGRAQSFNASARVKGEARPAWKVLRVLGNLLGLEGFDYESSEAVRDEVLAGGQGDQSALLNNRAGAAPRASGDAAAAGELERVAQVMPYGTDPIVRRSEPLQLTGDAAPPRAWISPALASQLGVADGGQLKVMQGQGSALLAAAIDPGLPPTVVRIAAAHETTSMLGGMFDAIDVEKA
ncbi:MAG: molybdopterin-dependent oxidoreductase, partial [Noviherbaspirillum sp.]